MHIVGGLQVSVKYGTLLRLDDKLENFVKTELMLLVEDYYK